MPSENDKGQKPPLSVQEAGRLGGKRTRETHGSDHFRRIGTAGGNALRLARSKEYYATIGKKGGDVVAKRGHEFFTRIGALGGKHTVIAHEAKAVLDELMTALGQEGRAYLEAEGARTGRSIGELISFAIALKDTRFQISQLPTLEQKE